MANLKPLPPYKSPHACARIGDTHTHSVPGQEIRRCYNCGEHILMTPPVAELTVLICLECAVEYEKIGAITIDRAGHADESGAKSKPYSTMDRIPGYRAKEN